MLARNKSRNIERLLYLAKEVRKTKPDRKCGERPPFYFGSYADSSQWDGKNQKLSCGTTACAIGLASTLPKFRRLGLRLCRHEGPFGIEPFILKGPNANSTFDSWEDVAFALGITKDEYSALFIPDSSPNYLSSSAAPEQVADQIVSFCGAAKINQEDSWFSNEIDS